MAKYRDFEGGDIYEYFNINAVLNEDSSRYEAVTRLHYDCESQRLTFVHESEN